MATMLEWFDGYVRTGLQPIAVFKDTKCPIGESWNKNWSVDKWRDYFKTDAYNMGILLGDIIDVEGDTAEANDLLLRMIDDVPHPMFRSSKSIHHLFLNPDPELTRWSFEGIEFRGFLHQSVVPPSLHSDGSQYGWLVNSSFKVPKLPDELLKYYLTNRNNRAKQFKNDFVKKRKIKAGHCRTQCKICTKMFYIHKKRLFLEVKAFQQHRLPWMCHSCREFDMKEPCRILRKSLRNISSQYVPLRND